MIFGFVLLCLDANINDCKPFYLNTYDSIEQCEVGIRGDMEYMDDNHPYASPQGYKCVNIPKGEML